MLGILLLAGAPTAALIAAPVSVAGVGFIVAQVGAWTVWLSMLSYRSEDSRARALFERRVVELTWQPTEIPASRAAVLDAALRLNGLDLPFACEVGTSTEPATITLTWKRDDSRWSSYFAHPRADLAAPRTYYVYAQAFTYSRVGSGTSVRRFTSNWRRTATIGREAKGGDPWVHLAAYQVDAHGPVEAVLAAHGWVRGRA